MDSHFKCVPWLVICCVILQVFGEEKTTAESPKDGSELDLEAQHQVAILKQINRINDDGSYTFGYEAADGSFKIETRDVLGNVKGMFGFIDESGQLKRISYSASNSSRPEFLRRNLDDKDSEEQDSGQTTAAPPLLYQQIVRPQAYVASSSATTETQVTTRRSFFRPTSPRTSDPTSTSNPAIRKLHNQHVERSESSSTPRTVVIQQIPGRSRRPQDVGGTTEKTSIRSTTRRIPTFGQHIRQPTLANFVPGSKVLNISSVDENGKAIPVIPNSPSAVIFGQYIRIPEEVDSTTPSFRRVVSTRRPVYESEEESDTSSGDGEGLRPKDVVDDNLYDRDDDRNIPQGNALRRQLAEERSGIGAIYGVPVPILRQRTLVTDDTADVYGGAGGGTPRPVPAIPFRGYFAGIGRPRVIDDPVLHGQYLGYAGPTRGPPSTTVAYTPDDANVRATPQPEVSRVPVAVLRPTPTPPTVPNPELLAQIMQYIMAQQVHQRQYPYPAESQYRSRFTPFQMALLQMLGINVPPEAFGDPYTQNSNYVPRYPPQAYPSQAYSPQTYPPPYSQQSPYEDPLYTQPYPPPNQIPYNIRRRIPYRQRPHYVPQQPPQYDSQPVPAPYPEQQSLYGNPYPAYNFVPRYVPSNPLPYDNPQVQYNQVGQENSRGIPVGMPQEYLPEEYRDAVFLRMLLAARAQQASASARNPQIQDRPRPVFVGQAPSPERGRPFYIQVPVSERPRPIYIRPDTVSETPRPIYSTEDSTNARSTTTSKPRTFAPTRNVQILDPVTEESTAKRSTNETVSPSS